MRAYKIVSKQGTELSAERESHAYMNRLNLVIRNLCSTSNPIFQAHAALQIVICIEFKIYDLFINHIILTSESAIKIRSSGGKSRSHGSCPLHQYAGEGGSGTRRAGILGLVSRQSIHGRV